VRKILPAPVEPAEGRASGHAASTRPSRVDDTGV